MLVLVLAANTAYNTFPQMASVLGRDGYLPRQFGRRGDRLVFSNGIILLATFAALLIVAFDASVTRLVQLYILGVFLSFSLSQFGMVRHWTAELRTATTGRRSLQASRIVNVVGRLGHLPGAGHRDPDQVHPRRMAGDGGDPGVRGPHAGHQAPLRAADLRLSPPDGGVTLPSRVHAVVLVSRLNAPGPAGPGLRPGHAPQHDRGPARRARREPHRATGEGVVEPRRSPSR